MKKKTFTGWIPKTLSKKMDIKNGDYSTPADHFALYVTRGNKIDWGNEDWPPTKVKITVEVID